MDNPFKLASVMVVEDDAFSRTYLTQMLDGIGMGEIVTASNGVEALAVLDARESGLGLIICDVAMPEMDGYEFIRRVRMGAAPAFKNVPIIVLTAHDSEKNLRRARVSKIDSFFTKPPSKKVLEKTIRRILLAEIRDAVEASEP